MSLSVAVPAPAEGAIPGNRGIWVGILSEMTGYARNRRFRYETYVRLFTEEAPEPA